MRRSRGFTLIEILIALTMFAVIGGGLLQLFNQGLRAARLADDRAHAVLLARSKLTELQAFPYLQPGTLTGSFEDGFRWEASLSPAAAAGNRLVVAIGLIAEDHVVHRALAAGSELQGLEQRIDQPLAGLDITPDYRRRAPGIIEGRMEHSRWYADRVIEKDPGLQRYVVALGGEVEADLGAVGYRAAGRGVVEFHQQVLAGAETDGGSGGSRTYRRYG